MHSCISAFVSSCFHQTAWPMESGCVAPVGEYNSFPLVLGVYTVKFLRVQFEE